MNNETFYYNEPINNKEVFIYEPKETLTTWGIFISSLLLSGGAFISQIITSVQKSKCVNIKCLGSSCIRKLSNEENV